ncbi:MAG: T9SS type A sorting domain-containing protein [Lentimicrobiaceae bacterium]|nr:T9SS type A sorting domain-containing protein [Lentimicrobiaceae bacterium]
MKKLFTLLFLSTALLVKAQYTTPGTGVNWSLDDLVTNSEGTVIWNSDHYEITNTLTISPQDAINILGDVTVLFHQLAGIVSEGTLLIDAPVQSIFTAQDTTLTADRWRGFKLIDGHVTHIKNATFSFGGGLRVQTGTFSIEGSTFYKNFYKSGSSAGSYSSAAALDISGYASVTNCSFILNQRGAIASGSNVACAANIRNNYMFGNTTENSNRPQINMGPSGENDTTFIIGNTIIGNGSTNSGGIAYSSLLGMSGNVVIDSNLVDLNRYGITLTGSPINSAIRYNTVTNNNIQNNPALGGSGLNFTASSASSNQQVVVTGNTITGNLWGITIIGYPQVNMGDSSAATFNPGGNVFADNGNDDIEFCDLYNNGPVNQMAMYNCWGVATQDSASIEGVVVHVVDDETLGRVNFMPSCAYETTFVVQNETGNLLSGVEIAIADLDESLFTDSEGQAWEMLPPGGYTFTASLEGYNVYEGSFTVIPGVNTVNITMSEIMYLLTFYVYDQAQAPVADAQIEVAAQTLFTDAGGLASLELGNGEYPYEVLKEGYYNANGTAMIANGNSEVGVELISLTSPTWLLTFTVTDPGATPLEGVSIAIEGQTTPLITNNQGIAEIELPDGIYTYTASLEGYISAGGNAQINGSDTSVSIELQPEAPTLYMVTFIVDSNTGIVGGAEIIINGDTLTTNEEGIATIELADGEYPYIATAIDYSVEEGVVVVDGADVEVQIFLYTGVNNPLAAVLKVYPNPVTDRLFLEGAPIDAAEVYSTTGKLLLRFEQVNGSIDLRNLEQGMYLIRMKSQGLVTTLRVVKK